jgi:hypothetical protein
MSRTVIVGDLHGCRAELEDLLARLAFGAGDRLVLVGDLVARGPDHAGTIDLAISLGARAVRGNHEDRLLRFHRRPDRPLGATHRAVAAVLAERHWSYLASLPLWIDLPEHGVRVVHAGVVPGVRIDEQKPRALMYMRCLDGHGKAREERGGALWGERYEGPMHVVFGHNAQADPQIHRHATGVDTGAVYGGRLTAMVLPAGMKPPPPRDRASVLVSVPARRVYHAVK